MLYVAHRLFAAHDRALGAVMAAELAAHVGADQVFLPYCDTSEDRLTDPEKGRVLYELDRARLERLDGMLAILHGPSLDDGVCMEIGFARRRGVPVVVMTTDFQTYGRAADVTASNFPDPLIDTLVSAVVHADPDPAPIPSGPGRFAAYREHQVNAVRSGAVHAAALLVDLTSGPDGERATPSAPSPPAAEFFVEPSPYALDEMEPAARAIRADGRSVAIAGRHSRAVEAAPMELARADWESAARADILVADLRGPETPPGAAALVGAFAAAGRPVIARRQPGGYTFAPGREPNYRNLMIQYAVSEVVASLDELRGLLS